MLIVLLLLPGIFNAHGQQRSKIKLGAYYFDGWTGAYPYHITNKLVDSFPEREPIWGWKTSTQSNVDAQIKVASAAGLSFFNFCWYFRKNKFKEEPLNRALSYYLQSPYKSRLKYCLTMVNANGFDVKPADWPDVVDEAVSQFLSGTYLKVNGKPLFVVYSIKSLVKEFNGSTDDVKQAFDHLRAEAKRNGLTGVTVACCVNPDPISTKMAEDCGADLLTAYNFQHAGFKGRTGAIPIESLQENEVLFWNKFTKITSLKFMPVITLNWDTRPWKETSSFYQTTPRYTGFSANTIYRSVSNARKWISTHRQNTTKEKYALVYAWNEYGEGAWLTPSKKGFNPLNGVKKAIR